MIKPNIHLTVWLTAVILLAAGAAAMGRAAMAHRRHKISMQESLAMLSVLQRLEAEKLAALEPVRIWEQTDAEPIAMRGLLRELQLHETVRISDERTRPVDIPGWNLRRLEIRSDTLSPDDLWQLIERAQSHPHPWRMRYCAINAIGDPATTLDVRLRFETLSQHGN